MQAATIETFPAFGLAALREAAIDVHAALYDVPEAWVLMLLWGQLV
ncbi:MAG: hypothetical protein HQ446_12775 [Polaromonas sp.]|nr:hypothetical protein [Polaromonas sp.]